MNRGIRSIHSMQGQALVFYAYALALLVIPAVVFVPAALGGTDQPHHTPEALTFPQIEVPGAMSTLALGINDRGQIVGTFRDAEGVLRGFLLDQGVFTPIDVDVPGATRTEPTGINNRGQIVGNFTDAKGVRRGFLLDQGVFTPIDVPGATSTVVYGINAHGQIAGFFVDARGMHGFCGTVRPGRKGGPKRSWAVGRQCQGSGEAK
jgi:probable HAF family extracellular repeat protein